MRQKKVDLEAIISLDRTCSRVLSEDSATNVAIIRLGAKETFFKGLKQIKRIATGIPDCSKIWLELIEKFYIEKPGQTILVEIVPEAAASYGTSFEAEVKRLSMECKKNHKVFYKTLHPDIKMYSGGEELETFQYIYDVEDFSHLEYLLETFRGYDMSRISVLKPGVDIESIAKFMRQRFLTQKNTMDEIFNDISYVVYFDYIMEMQLVIETVVERIEVIKSHIEEMKTKDNFTIKY